MIWRRCDSYGTSGHHQAAQPNGVNRAIYWHLIPVVARGLAGGVETCFRASGVQPFRFAGAFHSSAGLGNSSSEEGLLPTPEPGWLPGEQSHRRCWRKLKGRPATGRRG